MDDVISRQAAIDARRYTFGNDEFSLEDAYHDCKLVFDGITDDDSFQEADTGLILYYANEIIYALQEALEGKDTNVPTNDYISRQDAIDFVDAGHLCNPNEPRWSDNEVVSFLRSRPSVQPGRKNGKWNFIGYNMFECTFCGIAYTTRQLDGLRNYNTDPFAPKWCPNCGADMRGEQE